ncbi:MAG TPA: hypothetical protein VE732_04845 [Nitrososphaera sp.]|jgi:hypothetical protein|nr:hypothetical protein [Nitrososphaera sp.]
MSTPGCWFEIYAEPHFHGTQKLRFDGPAEIANLGDHPWPDGGDSTDDTQSVITGPNTWVIAYEDENFGDNEIHFGPGESHPDLSQLGWKDQIDSFKIFDHKPW